VVVDFATTQDIASYAALLRREGVSVVNHTPTVFMHLIREDAAAGAPIQPRIVFLGGEALNFTALKAWTARRPLDQCRLVNLYGPTEGAVLVTFHELSTADLDGGRSIVGRPLASAGVEIVNPDGSVAPQGVPGEIVMTGLGVAPRGYFKRPAETARRFFARAGDHGFRTGDLGRVAADGRIDFLGRLDRQIKVRGFRVEPGDIEAALLRSDWVRACAVGTRCQPGTDPVLVAYVAPSDGRCTPETLRDYARGQLPAYMVPSSFVLVERIPTTLSGKIDFDALAAAVPQARAVKGGSALEQWLFGLVAHKLGHDDFEVTDNLLDVGVTSLDAVDLVGSVRERLGPEALSVTDLFEHSTVRALALHLDGSPATPRAEGEARARAVARQAGLARRLPTRSLEPRGADQ
jgi:acyl-coenzyme A synthetase/AMP-(fatty) acid ligase/acyl carrier protein